jgi:hypothetical protein
VRRRDYNLVRPHLSACKIALQCSPHNGSNRGARPEKNPDGREKAAPSNYHITGIGAQTTVSAYPTADHAPRQSLRSRTSSTMILLTVATFPILFYCPQVVERCHRI